MMQRRRSNAIDINHRNPNVEDRENLYKMGFFLNFSFNSFVLHSDLDKVKIRDHLSGFCSAVAKGSAKEPLTKYIGKYLEPKDFAALRLVCKPM